MPLLLLMLLPLLSGCLFITPCEGLDDDADGVCFPDDCDGTRADVYPGAEEVCDGVDNDCDGTADESCLGAGPLSVGEGGYTGPSVVLTVPDLDGSGIPELAVGAPQAGDGGAVYLFFNGAEEAPLTIIGLEADASFGASLAYADTPYCAGLVIGSPDAGLGGALYWLPDEVLRTAGSTLRIEEPRFTGFLEEDPFEDEHDKRLGTALALMQLGHEPALLAQVPGVQDDEVSKYNHLCTTDNGARDFVVGERSMGAALLALDVHGEGEDDALFIGAPQASTPGVYVPNSTRLPGGVLGKDAVFLSGDEGSLAGAALAGGDLDGDGYEELFIGAPGEGRVWLLKTGVLQTEEIREKAFGSLRGEPGDGERFGEGIAFSEPEGRIIVTGCATCDDPASGDGGAWVFEGDLSGAHPAADARRLVTDTNQAGRSAEAFGGHVALGGVLEDSDTLAWILPLD